MDSFISALLLKWRQETGEHIMCHKCEEGDHENCWSARPHPDAPIHLIIVGEGWICGCGCTHTKKTLLGLLALQAPADKVYMACLRLSHECSIGKHKECRDVTPTDPPGKLRGMVCACSCHNQHRP